MTGFPDYNLYEILNINNNATQDEIKIAYRKLMHIYHPDINNTKESLETFKKIRKAYEILSDINKKKLYDIKYNFKTSPLKNDFNNNSSTNEKNENLNQKEKKDNIFKQLLNKLDFSFLDFSNKNKNKTKPDNKIFANVTISSKEAILGTSRIINIVQTEICPNCNGKKFINEALCPLCKGLGEISNHKKINVSIPAGVKNGEKIKVDKAILGENKGENNLILIISIEEKTQFSCKNNNIYIELPITPFEAALGANIEIPTLYENLIVKIPPNSSSGQKLRLKGVGLFNKEKNIKGDMIITLIIKIPQKLSDKEIELYKSLRENNNCNIREGFEKND